MDIQTEFNIGEYVQTKGKDYDCRGYVDSIMIHVKENNIEISYHFDGGSFDEKDVYPVNKDIDAQEIQSIKIRLGVLRRMRKLYPDDINLIEEYLSLSNRLSFLTEH